MSFTTKVRATWKNQAEVIGKDEKGKPIYKRYSARKDAIQYESISEATKDLGERNVLDIINKMMRKNANDVAKAKLIAKVTGGAVVDSDIEEIEIDDDDSDLE